VNAASNTERSCLCIRSQEKVQIFGDLDVFVMMDMHLVPEKIVKENLPESFWPFVSWKMYRQ
jgi:hypothetical protein